MKRIFNKNKYKYIKCFENYFELLHKTDYGDLEYVSKPNIGGEVDKFTRERILDVKNFDKWLSQESNINGVIGSPHLVGKVHILTPSLIEDYFYDQGVECTDEEIFDFIDKIKNEWMSRKK